MARLYNPREIYDLRTMPRVEGFAENNNCDFVRFHWVPTEAEQKHVDERGGHIFYRHSLINTKMYLATTAGAGIPGWDPFYGMSEAEKAALKGNAYFRVADQSLGTKMARSKRIQPTGLVEDPRLPPRAASADADDGNILLKLAQADARYREGVSAEHQRLLAEHAAQKTGTWAQRAAAPKKSPTLEDARRSYEGRLKDRGAGRYERRATRPGIWHEWEIVEISREEARQRRIEEAEARADATMKSRYPCWGGGT